MRYVQSADGTRLAVYESGPTGRPTIVAVHGYPDNHTVWDGLTTLLNGTYRVVTYDVRGTGESDKPRDRAAYRMEHLVDDLGAVIDAVSPDTRIHLLGHDWGSIQSWPAVTDPRFANRITSFTSISGPSLDYVGAWLRDARHHPRAAAKQLLASFYIVGFQLPRLPEVVMRSDRMARIMARVESRGRDAGATGEQPTRTEADLVNGIQMYRANMLPRLTSPKPASTDIPVQVLAPHDDIHAMVEPQLESPRAYVRNLWTQVISGGHWVVFDSPDVIARHVSDFVDHHEGAPASDALAATHVPRHDTA
jgi:pimeloyl-ACP methyl ester carboxylesterase